MTQDNSFVQECLAKNKEKEELLWALRTRILSDEEMGRVAAERQQLFQRFTDFSQDGMTAMSPSYSEADLEKRLNEALLQQFRLRHWKVVAK